MKSKDIKIHGGHLLKYISGDLWEFVPAFEKAPIYLTFNEKKTDIIALDSDGMGMPLMIGCQVRDYKIKGIFTNDEKYIVAMKLVVKEKIEDLEPGDVVYVTNTNNLYGLRKFEIDSIVFHEDDRIHWYDLTSKQNKHILVRETNAVKPLNSSDGVVSTFDGSTERLFSNNNYAKKYVYDKIQDKINTLRETQREIML